MKSGAREASVVNIADYRRPAKEGKRAPVWKHVALILVLILVAYFNSIGNGFVGDDISFVKDNTSIRDTANIPSYFVSSKTLAAKSDWGTFIYRPLRTTSYAVDYSFYELRAWGYHITNMALHMAACVAFYFLVMALLDDSIAALIAALIFALHPLHIEAVSWIASRADLIGFIFLALSLSAYVHYRKRPEKKALLALSLAFSLLAYLGKETMVPLPGMIIAYDYATRGARTAGETIRRSWPAWAGFSVLCFAYLALRFYVTGKMGSGQGWWGGTASSNFLMMAKATAIYLRLMVLPYGFTLHYMISPVHTLFDAGVMVSVAVILASVGAIVYFHFRNRLVFFLLLWFYLALVPIANIAPISFSMMAERYIYMASAGPIAAVAWALAVLYRRARARSVQGGRVVVAAIALVLAIFIVMIMVRNTVYKDDFTFYSAAVAATPASPPSNKGLADQYYKRKDYTRALEYYDRALKDDPGYVEAFLGKADALRDKGDLEGALATAQKAEALGKNGGMKQSTAALVDFSIGNIYREMGEMDAALSRWRRAVALNPDFSEAWNHIGNYYQISGDYTKALAMYEKSLLINPYNAEANYNAAMLYDARGEKEKARLHYGVFVKYAGPEYRDVVEKVRKNYR